MFKRLFNRGSQVDRLIVDAIYGEIVAAARQPTFYSAWDVPDTPLGRFEMMGLHVFLLLHRLRGEEGAAREAAQEITDEFFRDVDHSIRELGIGDVGVPKRMKKLSRMFYGRVLSYGEAIDKGDRAMLAEALARNVQPGIEGWTGAAPLAAYVMEAAAGLASRRSDEILAGRLHFADADELAERTT